LPGAAFPASGFSRISRPSVYLQPLVDFRAIRSTLLARRPVRITSSANAHLKFRFFSRELTDWTHYVYPRAKIIYSLKNSFLTTLIAKKRSLLNYLTLKENKR